MSLLRELQRALGFDDDPRGTAQGSLAAALDRFARRHPQDTAFRASEHMISHGEFASARHRCARWIRSQTMRAGESIAIVSGDRLLCLTIVAAAASVGAAVALAVPHQPPHVLCKIFRRARAGIVVTDPDRFTCVANALDEAESSPALFLTGPTDQRGSGGARRLDLALQGYSHRRIPGPENPSWSPEAPLLHVFGADGSDPSIIRTLTFARMNTELAALGLMGQIGNVDIARPATLSDEAVAQALHALCAGASCHVDAQTSSAGSAVLFGRVQA